MAEVLNASIVDFSGPFAVASVARDTAFTYSVGSVVHEVVDPDGNAYILFTAEVPLAQQFDLTLQDSLSGLALPGGWRYGSRTLGEDLHVASGGLATVFAAPGSSWQRYSATAVSSPGSQILTFAGLLGLLIRRRAAREVTLPSDVI